MRRRNLLAAVLAVLLLAPTASPAAAAPSVDTVLDITFPVGGSDYHYTDTYDASRGGGRLHKSTDIMAPRGTPVHAAVGGTVGWITGLDGNPPSYGYMLSIRGDDGLEHGYVHLGTQDGPPSAAYAPGIERGTRVERGQLIGYVGNSGCGCVDHLHYDVEDPRYPADDDHYDHFRYNPYRSLRAAEQRGDVPGAGAAGGGTPIAGDWDNDGAGDLGWWRAGETVHTVSDEVLAQYTYGRRGDVPIVADFDGDGDDTVSIIRAGEWHVNDRLAGGSAEHRFVYGRIGPRGDDIPIAGDWDGDGVDDIGIIRNGEWHLRYSLSGGAGEHRFVYGRIGPRGDDIPVIGDWDGDGVDDIGIIRNGEWHLRYSLSGGAGEHRFVYGRIGPRGDDIPVIGDWDGDGVDDIGIVRDGVWYLRDSLSSGPASTTLRPGAA